MLPGPNYWIEGLSRSLRGYSMFTPSYSELNVRRHHRYLWWLLPVLLLLPAEVALADDRLHWHVTPYLWATDTRYTLKADGSPVDTGKVTFDDLVDTADASFQVVVEAGRDASPFSAFADVTYLDTSDTYRGPLIRVDSDSEQWLVDAAVAWWPRGKASGFNVFAGATGRWGSAPGRRGE